MGGAIGEWSNERPLGPARQCKNSTSVQEQGIAPNGWRKATPIYSRRTSSFSAWRKVYTLNPGGKAWRAQAWRAQAWRAHPLHLPSKAPSITFAF